MSNTFVLTNCSADRMSDKQKSVLITGCSSGIGYALAGALADEKYRVFATVRSEHDRARLESAGLETLILDLDSSQSIRTAVASVLENTGDKLFALINNGAYGQPGAVEDLNRDTLRAQFETNVFGTQELTNQCIPIFRKQGEGRIIQISSILGRICMANRGAYNASKFALEALSDTMRLELYGSGIFVSLIEPGPIESRFRENARKAFDRYIDRKNTPHRATYDAVIKRLQNPNKAPFTLPASALVRPVRHALEHVSPKARYPVTVPSKVLPNVKRFISDKLMDSLLRKAGDQPVN
jgi:NAD(P)-dependent dehydrogenase (short-subunit alcohol dehydrogenase family)